MQPYCGEQEEQQLLQVPKCTTPPSSPPGKAGVNKNYLPGISWRTVSEPVYLHIFILFRHPTLAAAEPEQKLWFNIDNLRKVSLCKWKEGEVVREKTFTSWQSCYGPSIVNVEHFYFQGRVPIQMRYFFSSWRHDWLTSWPIQVLRNQTNIFFSMMSVQLSDLYRYCKARQTP